MDLKKTTGQDLQETEQHQLIWHGATYRESVCHLAKRQDTQLEVGAKPCILSARRQRDPRTCTCATSCTWLPGVVLSSAT